MVTLKVSRQDTRLTVSAKREALRLVDLSVNAEAPLETLAEVDKLGAVGFRGNGEVGPLTLDDLLPPNPDQTQPRGKVQASLDVLGTLVDPKVQVAARSSRWRWGRSRSARRTSRSTTSARCRRSR